MANTIRVARIAGIDIFIHWSWLIIFALLTLSLGDFYYSHFHSWNALTAYLVAAISALLLFVTVLLHELAHSITARHLKLPVHSITLYLFGGVSSLTQEPQSPRTELLVTMAGPLTSFAVSGVCWVLFLLARGAPSEIQAILNYLAVINLLLGVFNLIPGFPLDGGRVLHAIIWIITKNRRRATQIASAVGQGIGYLFIVLGLWEAFFLGDVTGGIYLAFIGWFLQNAASVTNQQVVLEQSLTGVDVRDVMDPPPAGVDPSTPIAVLVDRHMLGENQRAVPVVDETGALLGLVTLGDVRHVDRQEWAFVPVSRIMQPRDRLRTVGAQDHLAQALQALAENNYHQLPVMEDGHMIGVLNRAHVVQYLTIRRQLERTGGPTQAAR
ncbi:MAG TPA: site-2 protease family protein [Chloroflexota bacterium]|nr:site-2 protease family protein [Chloroflexota bacterium]